MSGVTYDEYVSYSDQRRHSTNQPLFDAGVTNSSNNNIHNNAESSSELETGSIPTGRDYTDYRERNVSMFLDQESDHPKQYGSPELEADNDASGAPKEPLVHNAAAISGSQFRTKPPYEGFEYADPIPSQTPLERFMDKGGRYPLAQRIEDKKRGIGRQKYPVVSWGLAVAMVGIVIYELVRNFQAQGSPISTKPIFNPMIGPSESALITFGARFPPCMKAIASIPIDLQLGCLNNTANPPTSLCSLEDICAFGGFHGKDPNQWFRFITPIFIHAGIVHILLNMIAQLLVSARVEKDMGSGGFLILYFAAGIFGNVLGGNFALLGAPSVGASGAIFGTVAATWIDLLAHWRYKYRPIRQLVALIIELIIGIGLGYIPGVDNFAHLGGFFMGLLVSTTLYPVVSPSTRHKTITWVLRLATIPVAVVLMVVLIRNFYTGDPYSACAGCRYLSCFPTSANNHCQGNGLTISQSGSSV